MKNIIFILFSLLASSNLFAENLDRKSCIRVLEGAVYNVLLEETCGFKGGVSTELKLMYAVGQCPSKVSKIQIDKTVKEVYDDMQPRLNSFGKKRFCQENKEIYDTLIN